MKNKYIAFLKQYILFVFKIDLQNNKCENRSLREMKAYIENVLNCFNLQVLINTSSVTFVVYGLFHV